MPENDNIKDTQGMLDLTRELKNSLSEKNEVLQRSLNLQKDLVSSLQSEAGFTKQLTEGSLSASEAKSKQVEAESLLSSLQEARAEELEKEKDGNQMLVDILGEQILSAEDFVERIKQGVEEMDNSNKSAETFAKKLQKGTEDFTSKFKLPSGLNEAMGIFTGGMKKSAKAGGSFMKSIKGGMKALKANVFALVLSAVVGIVKALASANNRITALAKGLGVSKDEARVLNKDLNAISISSSNWLNTSKEIKKAFADINNFLGTSSTVITDQLIDGVATLQNRMGLSKDAAMGFAQASLLSGKSIDDIKKDSLMVSNTTSAIYGTRLDDKAVLEEAAKTTGVIRSQSQGNLEILAKSVATAKSFGISLKEVAAAGKQLLNFEESISAELEAELLTGKQLNLEQARLAALTGDYETLTKEIMKNVGDIHEFNSMNVLQQEALAKSVGMEANQLADVLMKRQNLEQLAQEARDAGREDLARQYEQLSTQQKFNAAIEKLKDFLVIIVEGLESGKGIFSAFNQARENLQENAKKQKEEQEKIKKNETTNSFDYDRFEKIIDKQRVVNVQTSYNGFNANNTTSGVHVTTNKETTSYT